MPLAAMGEITGPARDAGRGVGAFNVIGVEHAEAIVAGAEAARAPVVLQISENCAAYHGALDPIARACLAVAAAAAVPVAVHLDHASSADLVRAAAGLGLGSVMFDASARPYTENVLATAEMARWCQDRGVWVEAELGEIGGKNGVHHPLARTDPDEAAGYVAATGVDATLDLALVERLRQAVDVPLVLHGSSGVPDEVLAAAVRAGMTKINIATQLNKVYTAAVRDYLAAEPAVVDPRRYGSAGRDAIAPEVARLLGVIGAAAAGVAGGGAGESLPPVERAARAAGHGRPAPGGGRGQGAERIRGHHPS
jgi:fructose-bisphosphate aldolase class II